ncbi:D-alanyl-D-alanine carboxypeptidase [Streptomyces cinnabarinus]|uniref:serine-type D-Ala-D-Ala carboxypeptidase n=1 Tax=Streptomyces cinnabarinus TaxID=67287 RepID=A0ABY7KDE1_9ACTN|nr:D-alanyl-D-alanine carboxypeptidase [Streptomyces cinnabarinus]WAZ22359.1 D-alanyl-D-alanine carboxypeptidase [Streptomyces cinnabarinus]
MAGESPDSSKQRESSAEPTSGSAGAVPEARNKSTDPRLAMSRGGVDTATRVLSAQDLAEARNTAPEPSEPSEASEEPDQPEAEPAAPGNDRLRAAVAAWVASGDDRAAGGTDAADTAEEADAEADADSDVTPAGDAERVATEPETETGSDDTPAGEDEEPEDAEPEPEATADDSDDDADTAPEAATATEDQPEAAEEATDDADDKAPAAQDAKPARTTDETPSADAPAPANDAKTTEQATTPPTSDATTEGDTTPPAGDSNPAQATATPADDDSKQRATAAPTAEGDPQSAAAPDAAEGSPRDASAPVDTKTTQFSFVNAKATTPEPAADKATPSAEGESPADKATPAAPAEGESARSASAADKATPAPAEGKPATDKAAPTPPKATPPAPGDASRAGGKTTTGEGDAKPVDQPTTALRFVPLKSDITTAIPQVGPERTTQQPLPPKPPLDLLAELTNTPPPPETPVRTLVRRVKIWTPLVLLLVVVFAIVQSVRPVPTPTLDLTAKSSYTFEGSKVDIPWPADGQAALDVQGIGTFGSSGDQKPVPIASVAKVMTAYVILRDHPLKSGEEGPKIEIDQAAEEQSDAGQESTVDVFAGDSITEREALESILIASANNVARLLARWDAGSEKAFVEKMNSAAEDLGMSNTTYTDPSGLNDTTVSTAVDQVKLAKAAMESPAFREVAAMMSYDDYKGQNHGNWNQLVGKNNVVGIKTGTTTSALGNLVFAAKQDVGGETRTIVGAVVRQPDAGGGILAAALDSGDQLIRAAQGALESATLLKKGDVVGYVDDGLGGRTAVVATKDVKAAGWSGLKVELDFAADAVPHEAKAGTKVGTLTVGDGGTAGAVKVPVALQSDLVEPGFMAKLTRIL